MRTLLKETIRTLKRGLDGFALRKVRSAIEVERAEYTFYINYLRPGMVVFDVGANVGSLTMLFSKFVSPTGCVHAFECNKHTFGKLKVIIDAFSGGGKDMVVLNQLGLSDRVEERVLYEYQQGNGDWTTLARRELHLPSGGRVTPSESKILTSTLDIYCRQNSVPQIDLLKIDVEGAEFEVLLGARDLLRNKRVKCITFEFGQTLFDMGKKPDDLIKVLHGFGYEIRNLISSDPIFPGGANRETAMFSMHVSKPPK